MGDLFFLSLGCSFVHWPAPLVKNNFWSKSGSGGMTDTKVFERAAEEADRLAKELAELRRDNHKLRDQIDR